MKLHKLHSYLLFIGAYSSNIYTDNNRDNRDFQSDNNRQREISVSPIPTSQYDCVIIFNVSEFGKCTDKHVKQGGNTNLIMLLLQEHPPYLSPKSDSYLVKVNPTKGRLFPEKLRRFLEGRSGKRRSSFSGSNLSKLDMSSALDTRGT